MKILSKMLLSLLVLPVIAGTAAGLAGLFSGHLLTFWCDGIYFLGLITGHMNAHTTSRDTDSV